MEEQFLKQLGKACSYAKVQLTKKINKIKALMNDHENLLVVKELLAELHDTMKIFKTTHEAYHHQLKSESKLHESNEYRASVEAKTNDFQKEIDSWLTQIGLDIEKSFRHHSHQEVPSIEPEDSISNVASCVSYHTRSSIGSVLSAASAQAKVAARKAALEAEILEHLQQLEVEELILQQHRKQLTLCVEIAAAEAEKDAYDRVESEVLNEGFSSPVPSKKFEKYQLKDVTPKEGTSSANLRSTTTNPEFTSISTPILPNNPLISQSHDESLRRLVEVKDQQSYALTQLMKQQQQGVKALTLQQPSMQIFSGNPIDYCDFIRSFKHFIELKTASPSA